MATKNSLLKGRWTIWALSLFFSLLAGFGVLLIVGKAADRVPYYVASSDMAARTPITSSNTKQVDVNADAVPPTAISLAQIQSGTLFAQVPLSTGDAITSAVAGTLNPINYNLPSNFVAASIQVAPERAVGGKLKRGDYIDIAATTGTGLSSRSKVVMSNILVLDVTVNPSSISAAANSNSSNSSADPGPESAQVRNGIPKVYTLALTPDLFAQLSLLQPGNILLGLTNGQNKGSVSASADLSRMFNPGPAVNGKPGTEGVFGTPATPTPTPSPTEIQVNPPTGEATPSVSPSQ